MTRIYYGQNREDIILESFFIGEKTGFYVDVGAYDPIIDSVTKRFYDNGWSGINIEPQPDKYALFVKKRPRDINLNIGISNKNTTLTLRSYKNQGLSTFSEEIKNGYKGQAEAEVAEFKDIEVPVMTLESVFKKYDVKEISFMKIDAEGFEYEVIDSNNWTKYRPRVLCIEANHIVKNWRTVLLKNNYILAFNDGLNDYYVDKMTKKKLGFDYIDHVVLSLGGGVRYQDYKLAEEATKKRDKHIQKLDKILNHQNAYIMKLENTISKVNENMEAIIQTQNSPRWLAGQLKRVIKRKIVRREDKA